MKLKAPSTIFADSTAGWCPGCGHGIIVRLLAEAVESLGIEERLVLVVDVACGSLAVNCIEFNNIGTAHGRPIITAAGVKRARPAERVVAHAGDGSAYSIGTESTIHCALRNENILALVVNNGVFGMTGGQMSPTTLVGQKTATSEKGRIAEVNGDQVNIMKLLSQFDVAYLARGSVHDAASILKTKQFIRNAFEKQMRGEGYTCVEVISPCPTNWHMTPQQASERIKKEVLEVYPLGEFVKGE